MKKLSYVFYLVLGTVIIGCDRQHAKYVCTCEQQKKVQQFIERSIKPANNMSDGEMEDVIHQLWVTGVRLNCGVKVLPADIHNNIDWDKAKIDSCEVAYDWVY